MKKDKALVERCVGDFILHGFMVQIVTYSGH